VCDGSHHAAPSATSKRTTRGGADIMVVPLPIGDVRARLVLEIEAVNHSVAPALIDHGIPNRSTHIPKRSAQNVFSSGILT
jgi:hypothetical protein